MTHCFCLAQPYIAIDWDPDIKKKYYNENEAEVRLLISSLILKKCFASVVALGNECNLSYKAQYSQLYSKFSVMLILKYSS